MTWNVLKGHFTLYVHYYELPLTNYLLLSYCSLFIARVTNACDQRISAGSGVANNDPQNIWSAENLRIFRGRHIDGTLTNNANIIIYTVFQKNGHPFCFCYNFVSRDQILVIFGTLVAKEICNCPLVTYIKEIADALR